MIRTHLVSPAPRRAPEKTTAVASASVYSAASRRRVRERGRMDSSPAPKPWEKIWTSAGAPATKTIVMSPAHVQAIRSPRKAARRAPGMSPAPTRWPASEVTAAPTPSIGMKATRSQLNVIVTAAATDGPYDCMSRTKTLKAKTLTNNSTPTGVP